MAREEVEGFRGCELDCDIFPSQFLSRVLGAKTMPSAETSTAHLLRRQGGGLTGHLRDIIITIDVYIDDNSRFITVITSTCFKIKNFEEVQAQRVVKFSKAI